MAARVGREMLISCGAALFNIRVALRHLGYVPAPSILPDPDRPGLVARVRWEGQVRAVDYEEQLYSAIERRHTHRSAFLPDPPPARVLGALGEEAAREGAMLHIADSSDERAALAAVVTAAEHAAHLDGELARQVARWTRPPDSPRHDGPGNRVPDQDSAHRAGLSRPGLRPRSRVGARAEHDGAAAPLCWRGGPADHERRPACRLGPLRTGAAASAAGSKRQRDSAALHSQPLEMPELREFIRIRLSRGAYPQMLLRFGATDTVTTSTRRPAEEVLL